MVAGPPGLGQNRRTTYGSGLGLPGESIDCPWTHGFMHFFLHSFFNAAVRSAAARCIVEVRQLSTPSRRDARARFLRQEAWWHPAQSTWGRTEGPPMVLVLASPEKVWIAHGLIDSCTLFSALFLFLAALKLAAARCITDTREAMSTPSRRDAWARFLRQDRGFYGCVCALVCVCVFFGGA